MKTLTIKNPWAELICSGKKDIENRTWKTSHRGKILVHAAKQPALGTGYNYSMPDGAIIGEVEIVDVIKNSRSKWAIRDCWHWVLSNPVLYDYPIENVMGLPGFWDYR
jgi:hypothetical protein